MATNKRKRAAAESLIFLLVIAAIVVVVNLIGFFTPMGHADLTRNKAYSLASSSKALVAGLKDRMQITAYFTQNLPPPFNRTEREVVDMLSEYERASHGNVVVHVVHPDTDALRTEAQADGVQPQVHQVLKNDAVTAVEGYRGLVIRYLGDKQTIPAIQSTSGLEYKITMAIKQLLGKKTAVGVLTGHEGPTLDKGLSSLRVALPTYDLQPVDATKPIDQKLEAVLIVGPETPLSADELKNLDIYVMNGGSLGIFGGDVKLDLQGGNPSATLHDSGLDGLINNWGVNLDKDLVYDALCTRVPMRGPMGIQIATPYPPMPIVNIDPAAAKNPVVFEIPTILMPFTSSITLQSAPAGAHVTVLASSSKSSWKVTDPTVTLEARRPDEWSPTSDRGPFPLLVAIEGELPSGTAQAGVPPKAKAPVRVLVSGSSALLRDEFLPHGNDVQGGNAALALNAVDWLAAEKDLVAIRAKSVDDPNLNSPTAVKVARDKQDAALQTGDQAAAIKAREQGESAIERWHARQGRFRWLNTLGLPIAVALFGVIRWRLRKRRRVTL